MRLVWVGFVFGMHALMRLGTRLDEWITMRRRWTPLDAETVTALELHFRERYRAIDAWLPAQIGRLAPGGAMRYAAWRLGRRRRVDTSVPWTLGAPSLADRVSALRSEFFGMNSPDGRDCYPAPTDEDNYLDLLGTSANPYRSTSEVGKRRR